MSLSFFFVLVAVFAALLVVPLAAAAPVWAVVPVVVAAPAGVLTDGVVVPVCAAATVRAGIVPPWLGSICVIRNGLNSIGGQDQGN